MRFRLVAVLAVFVVGGAIFSASASAKGRDVFKVCKHGCKYSSVQKAVDKVKKGSKSMVKIKPGTYHEGVILSGHKYDKLIITGTTKPKKTILDGKNARIQGQPAQNGIDAINVDGLKIKKLWARNFPTNGFFVHADPGDHCHGFAMDKDWASFNGSYGLFAKHCTGGKITNSKGWGHGDSAIYIGETPPQDKPKWTDIGNDKMYENVLGYSGTNSKYVDIHDSMFYNNGAGVVPEHARLREVPAQRQREDPEQRHLLEQLQLLPAEVAGARRSPAGSDMIGDRTINYPTGVGVVLFGSDGWLVKNNQHLRQLHVGRGGLLGSVQHRGGQQEQPASSTTRWARTAPTRTSSTSSTTAPARATASRATRPRRFYVTPTASAPAVVPVSELSRAEQRRHRDQPG